MSDAVWEALEVYRAVAESAGLRLIFNRQDAHVVADRDRIIQVVTNLVSNAVKHTDPGGEIEVTISPDQHFVVTVRLPRDGTDVPCCRAREETTSC